MPQLTCSKGVYENQPVNMYPKSILYPAMATTLSHASGICHLVASAVPLLALGYAFFPIAARDPFKLQIRPPPPTPPAPNCESEPSHFLQLCLALRSCFIQSCFPGSLGCHCQAPPGPRTHQAPPFSRLCLHPEHSSSSNPQGSPFPQLRASEGRLLSQSRDVQPRACLPYDVLLPLLLPFLPSKS